MNNIGLPNEWEILKFKECIKQLNTGLNPRNNFTLGNGNIKYITAKNLTRFGTIDFSKCDFIDENAKKIINKRSDIKVGDILFSSRAPIGQCHLITENPDYFDIGESIFSIRVKEEVVLPEYFRLFLSSDLFIKMASVNVTGSVIQEIRVGNLMNTDVIVPPILIQKEIANRLNKIDSKINNNNKINAELESMSKTLYDYWFLQFEFPNEEGKPYKSSGGKMIWNEELKREIPKGWEVKKVGDILEEANKSKIQVNDANEKGKYPFFTSGESVLAFDEYLVDGFNIFLNTGGNPDIKAYMGKCAYSTDTWCVSAKEFSYVLYYHLLKLMPQFEQLFFAGSGLKHLQKDSLKNQYILLPDDKPLKRFNNTCVLNWKKTTNCLIVNQELTSLRDFLLPLLMNGQVTFKDK